MPAPLIQVRKHDLTIALQQINPHPKPKAALEQYTIPADLAAEILFTACYAYNDIQAKTVLDLGTGTGRLAIGASILGAAYAVGVDIDAESLGQASLAERRLQTHVDFIHGTIESVHGSVDTVLMNPPFGTKMRHADIRFLETALRVGNSVYSIHKSATRKFLDHWLESRGLRSSRILATEIAIPHQFDFHRKPRRAVSVDVLRISRRK